MDGTAGLVDQDDIHVSDCVCSFVICWRETRGLVVVVHVHTSVVVVVVVVVDKTNITVFLLLPLLS